MALSGKQIDALKEIINIGMGKGANQLNTIVKSHVRLFTPTLKIITTTDLKREIKLLGASCLMMVSMVFRGTINGDSRLIFSTESASSLVLKLVGVDTHSKEVKKLKASVISELGNIVLNSVTGTLGNLLRVNLNYSVPKYFEGGVEDIVAENVLQPDPVVILAGTEINIENENIDGGIAIFIEEKSFADIISAVDNYISEVERNTGHLK